MATDENEIEEVIKKTSEPFSHECSQSNGTKIETSHDGELDKNPDIDSSYSEKKESFGDSVHGIW